MAVGLACAGSGLKDAVNLLEPMLSDAVDFVRQVRTLNGQVFLTTLHSGSVLSQSRLLEFSHSVKFGHMPFDGAHINFLYTFFDTPGISPCNAPSILKLVSHPIDLSLFRLSRFVQSVCVEPKHFI